MIVYRLLVFILLINASFGTTFLAYDLYKEKYSNQQTQNSEQQIKETEGIRQSYEKKINTLTYTNFLERYNFLTNDIQDISEENIVIKNSDHSLGISFNCIIFDQEGSEKCLKALEEVNQAKDDMYSAIKNVQKEYLNMLSTSNTQAQTIEEHNKEINTIISVIMAENKFENYKNKFLEKLNNLKQIIDIEYQNNLYTPL